MLSRSQARRVAETPTASALSRHVASLLDRRLGSWRLHRLSVAQAEQLGDNPKPAVLLARVALPPSTGHATTVHAFYSLLTRHSALRTVIDAAHASQRVMAEPPLARMTTLLPEAMLAQVSDDEMIDPLRLTAQPSVTAYSSSRFNAPCCAQRRYRCSSLPTPDPSRSRVIDPLPHRPLGVWQMDDAEATRALLHDVHSSMAQVPPARLLLPAAGSQGKW